MGNVTALTLITDALIEIGVLPENKQPAAEDSARSLRILNRDIVEPWSVQRQFASGRVFTDGTFAASTATRTIGPTGGGSFVLTPRPLALISAARIDANGFASEINIRDSEWWNSLGDPAATGSLITDIYYEPDYPNGTMHPWPIPSETNTVRVGTQSAVSAFADLTTLYDIAPGYESAIAETLKELLCRAFNKPISADLAKAARNARAAIQIVNMSIPRRAISDAPSTMTGSVGSDPTAFKNREF